MNEMFMYRLGQKRGGGSGGGEEWIGDGNTHIWISLPEGRTSPMLGVGVYGTVTVDWGDGSAPDTLTGTNVTTTKWTPNHEYSKAGDYVITLSVDGSFRIMGDYNSNSGAHILRHSSGADARNKTYQGALKKIEIGNKTVIGDIAFRDCYGLSRVTIPESVTSIGAYAFSGCRSIENITIPESVTSIGTYAFDNCSNLASITIPNGVTKIGSNMISYGYSLASVTISGNVTSIGFSAFRSCAGVTYYDFSKHTAVPTLEATNAFADIAADCEIRVPAALVDEWKAATNWSTYADNIVGV
jgi:hypothetical protein